jgi:hypothetical protein
MTRTRTPADPAPSETKVRSWTLVIPGWRPVLDNELIYVHWSKARRRKRADVRQLVVAGLAYGVPRATGRRRLTLTIRQATGPFPDDTAPLKSLWDALKHAGLIVDDSREWLEMVWPPTFERGPKGTVIVLEDL